LISPSPRNKKENQKRKKEKKKRKTTKRTSHPHAQNKIIADLPLCPTLKVMIFRIWANLRR
jgi:hypothetical protein